LIRNVAGKCGRHRSLRAEGRQARDERCQSDRAQRRPNPVLQAFTDHYYNTFDTARANLASLYQEQSMLTFEGQKFQGMQAVS
jgi:hypothetical protein